MRVEIPRILIAGTLLLGCSGDGRPMHMTDAGERPDAGPPPEGVYDLFEVMADPAGPAKRTLGIAELASSRQVEPPEQFENLDWLEFASAPGDDAVLLEADGPGAITRFWLTMRANDGRGHDVLYTNDLTLRLEIDGVMALDDVSLFDLVGYDGRSIPGFPRPWVAGPDTASGGFLVTLPIHFQRSVRFAIVDDLDVDIYYHVDWRRFPEGTVVRPYEGMLAPEQETWLARATDLWVDRTDRGAEMASASELVMPGQTLTVTIPAGVLVRRIELPRNVDVTTTIEVDGEVVAAGDSGIWVGDVYPGEPYASALVGYDETARYLDYPFPVRSGGELRLQNDAAKGRMLAATVRFDRVELGPEYGALRVQCFSVQTPDIGGTALESRVQVHLGPFDGGPGHFAGQVMALRASMWGYSSLEGDHEIFVDGVPALLGTGVEDFFAGAHYFTNGTYALPTHGMTGRFEMVPNCMPETQMMRTFVFDGIPFARDFEFTYEGLAAHSRWEGCHFYYAF